MNIRGRLALLASIIFGFVMAIIAKQSPLRYSMDPIIIGLLSFAFAQAVFWIAFLILDIFVWGKNKLTK